MTFSRLLPRLRRATAFRVTLGIAAAGLAAFLLPAASPAPANREAPAPVAAPAAATATGNERGSESRSSETNAPSRLDFSAFRIIAERNIFNPNRTARSTERPPRETRRAPRVESFALVGTMSYAKGAFAFFDGSSSDLRKSLSPGGTIAGYTVREIKAAGVKLEGHGSTLELPVNGQLRREDDGEWQVSTAGDRPSYSSSGSGGGDDGGGGGRGSRGGSRGGSSGGGSGISGSSGPSGAAADSGTETASGSGGGASDADVNEVLRKLMEQREKELK